MESNARFVIGVAVEDIEADPIEFLFQQELLSPDRIMVRTPKRILEELGPEKLTERLADYYLSQHPAEVERVGKESLVRAIRSAMERHTGEQAEFEIL